MTEEKNIPRWVYRFDNYKRAFALLREALEIKKERAFSQLENEGVIQRFKFTWELAWKTLRDYVEYSGIILPTITPSAVIKATFAAKIIQDGETWMRALDARNKMSHTYDFKKFEAIIEEIDNCFFEILDGLHSYFLEKSIDYKDI